MPDVPVLGHKLFDALWNREHLVQKLTPKLEADGTITTKPILSMTPEARSCPNSGSCQFGHVVAAGGEPCNRCRRLIQGDYHC